MADSHFWRNLRADFESLQPRIKVPRIWKSDTDPPQHFFECLEGPMPLQSRRPSPWSRLSELALRGAKALGYDSEDAWYDELRRSGFVDLKITGHALQGQTDDVTVEYESDSIDDVLKVSITFCRKLEADSATRESTSPMENPLRTAEWEANQASTTEPSGHESTPMEGEQVPDRGIVNGADQRALVDAFLVRCNQEPDLKINLRRKHIWLAVGHRQPRQFQYWQAGSDKATGEDARNFARILGTPPAVFIALLKKKGIV